MLISSIQHDRLRKEKRSSRVPIHNGLGWPTFCATVRLAVARANAGRGDNAGVNRRGKRKTLRAPGKNRGDRRTTCPTTKRLAGRVVSYKNIVLVRRPRFSSPSAERRSRPSSAEHRSRPSDGQKQTETVVEEAGSPSRLALTSCRTSFSSVVRDFPPHANRTRTLLLP